jgi:hypothetical protein
MPLAALASLLKLIAIRLSAVQNICEIPRIEQQ